MNNLDGSLEKIALLGGCNFVDGRLVPASAVLDVTRPSDRALYARTADSDAGSVDDAVRNAHSAWSKGEWRRSAPRDRMRVLRRWADLIDSDPVLGWIEAIGSTRPIREVIGHDVPFTAEGIRFFAEWADKLGGEIAATSEDKFGAVLSEPYGVVAAIAPWNFPLSTASWKVGAALAAGNAIVLKPSELTPFSSIRLAELAVAAGVPAGIFNVVNGRGATAGRALVQHPFVSKVSFTGSTATGIEIMTDAAVHGPKPVTLELGGKSPQLVFPDANLELAAENIARSVLGNAGQVCVAGTRLIAQRSIADELIERITVRMKVPEARPTWDEAASYSPIASERQMLQVCNMVSSAVADGGELVIGGRVMTTGDGAFFEPTVLTGLGPSALAVEEEIFGPVLTVQSFNEEEEGLSLADHPRYGLAAGVYTRDLSRALRSAKQLQAGTVWINRYGRTYDFIVPTGGYKGSGFGKDLGRQAVEENLRQKAVLISL